MTCIDPHSSDIDRTSLIELTGDLIEIPSENPPGNEEAVVEEIVRWLEESPIGFDIDVTEALPERPNVIARAGDPERGSVLFNGHTDVVPADPAEWSTNPYTVRRRGSRLVGRGVADMKGAIAAKLLAAEAYLTNTNDPGEVVLGFVVDEEHKATGTRTLVQNGLDVDCAIIGEPTKLQACIAQKGDVRYRIEVEGQSAHSGTPDDGTDAIRAATKILEKFRRFDEKLRKETEHPLLSPETLTVTEIDGGIAPNVVADRVEIGLDWRLLPGREATTEELDDSIEETISEAELDSEVRVEFDRTIFARSAEIPPDHEIAEEVIAAASDVGIMSESIGLNAGTDARLLIRDADIPTVVFGPGSIADDAHQVDESVSIESLELASRAYQRILERQLG